MQARIARWGDSLGIRLPKAIIEQIGLVEGAQVDVTTEDDRIVISPARPRYRLANLIEGMTPEAIRDTFDWGDDQGREAGDGP